MLILLEIIDHNKRKILRNLLTDIVSQFVHHVENCRHIFSLTCDDSQRLQDSPGDDLPEKRTEKQN